MFCSGWSDPSPVDSPRSDCSPQVHAAVGCLQHGRGPVGDRDVWGGAVGQGHKRHGEFD